MFNQPLVLFDKSHDLTQFVLRESIVARDTHRRRDPELRLDLLTNHMDMDRFPAFLTEKEEPIWPNSQDCWHISDLFQETKLVYPIRLGYQADSDLF